MHQNWSYNFDIGQIAAEEYLYDNIFSHHDEDGTGNIIDGNDADGNEGSNSVSPMYYLPCWQLEPLALEALNYNYLKLYPSKFMRDAVENGTSVLSDFVRLDSFPDRMQANVSEVYSSYRQHFWGDLDRHYDGEPTSILFYPVFNTHNKDDPQRTAVGLISLTIFWDMTFYNIIPSTEYGDGNRKKRKNENGQSILTVVIGNSCGELHTYILTVLPDPTSEREIFMKGILII